MTDDRNNMACDNAEASFPDHKTIPSLNSALREVVNFCFHNDGSGEFTFWLGYHQYRLPLDSLRNMSAALGRAMEEHVTLLSCAEAVGPLLEAMANLGWMIAPPASNMPIPGARSTSERT
jgi:hypothetical protein